MDNLLASTEIGTIFLDAQLRIRKFTPQITDTFGLLPHDVGRSIETFAHQMHHPALVADLKQVLESGKAVERDLTDLQGRAFFLRLLPYRVKGVVDGVVLTLIDVTGLKAAEDALFHERYLLNSLLRTVPDAIYFKDARGKYIRCNHAMAARLGVEKPKEAIGKTAFDMPQQDAAMAMHREDEAVLRGGQPQHYRLEKRVDGSGAEAWDMVSRLPLRDRNNATVGVIAIFRDVTEQVRAKAKIDDEVRRRDQFLAMLSHELRNPLGAVVTATAMLKAADADDLHGRMIDVLQRQSRHMARLLDDLLDASRVTQNKVDLRRRVIDLRVIISEAADALRSQVQERGLDLVVDLPDEPMRVHGDATRLQQVFINLLNNAIKYTPSGGHVTVTAAPDGNAAVVRVRDDGAGIAPQMLDSVFDLFVQARHTLDHSDGGLGVGLTLVRALVDLHGGTVTARSEGDGKGSEFEVRLPMTSAMADAQLREASPPVIPPGTTIVVVEDNADSLEMLCSMLTLAGATCHSAGDGRSALALVDQVSPDVVILDVGLPHLDGLEVARRIRSNPRHAGVRLIALTGYGLAGDRRATAEAGFDYHFVKPVQPTELINAIAGETSDSPSQSTTSESRPRST